MRVVTRYVYRPSASVPPVPAVGVSVAGGAVVVTVSNRPLVSAPGPNRSAVRSTGPPNMSAIDSHANTPSACRESVPVGCSPSTDHPSGHPPVTGSVNTSHAMTRNPAPAAHVRSAAFHSGTTSPLPPAVVGGTAPTTSTAPIDSTRRRYSSRSASQSARGRDCCTSFVPTVAITTAGACAATCSSNRASIWSDRCPATAAFHTRSIAPSDASAIAAGHEFARSWFGPVVVVPPYVMLSPSTTTRGPSVPRETRDDPGVVSRSHGGIVSPGSPPSTSVPGSQCVGGIVSPATRTRTSAVGGPDRG